MQPSLNRSSWKQAGVNSGSSPEETRSAGGGTAWGSRTLRRPVVVTHLVLHGLGDPACCGPVYKVAQVPGTAPSSPPARCWYVPRSFTAAFERARYIYLTYLVGSYTLGLCFGSGTWGYKDGSTQWHAQPPLP